MKKFVVLFILLITVFGTVGAQTDVTVPDVTGLNLPQAVATLNRAGLALGSQIAQGWTEASGLPQNTIASQSLAAGSTVARGSLVDLTLLRSPNMRLVYDDNDITVMNLTGSPINAVGIVFTSTQGATASYAASQWSNSLRENQCFQLWTVGRNGPKDVEGCRFIQTWRSTTDSANHFWTQSRVS